MSNLYSKKLIIAIKERINLLKNNPKLGKEIEFHKTRIISLGHYSILYQIIDVQIIITDFWR